MYALMNSNYTPLKEGTSYLIIEEGTDWIKIKYNGKPLMISKKLVHSDPISTLYELPLTEETQEEIYDEKLDTFNTIFM
tara:strand:+ start:970 stop:1206 length:237 start_codon:yes stop_codon:yes gene_type:complete